MVKCPHCGKDNEITATDLQENDVMCQWSNCAEMFSTCGSDDFMRYLGFED